MKDGCEANIGGSELIDEFYRIFAVNMRDLGSPVHSKRLFVKVFEEFGDQARVFLIRKEGVAIAGSIVIGYKDTLYNPWASSMRKYSQLSPNMLLYWRMLEYACERGFAHFDFGRSTPGEGTFKFKEQWGSASQTLNWSYVLLGGGSTLVVDKEGPMFGTAVECWKRLPMFLTRVVGPRIRKHIGL